MMIREKSLFCKLFRIKISAETLFLFYMAGFNPYIEVCTYCKSTGNCAIFAHYTRNLIDFHFGKAVYYKVVVTRVKCGSCGHTHAILPDIIIPYATYSIDFILWVLAEYFMGHQTVEKLCEKYAISHCMLYRWIALFNKHKALWLGAVASAATSSMAFLENITGMECFSDFTVDFLTLTGFSYLQSHANPACSIRGG
jgi:hypothetical protein